MASRWAFVVCAVVGCGAGASCTEKGYRTEVHAGNQGQIETRRVPVPIATAPAPAPAVPQDPDLAKVYSLWPRLNPEDRKRVADMARRLAGEE